ncbi:MAG: phosphotransferase [Roseiflexaceae bacterium]
MTVLTDPAQADAAWLEAVLRHAGLLTQGGVAHVAHEPLASTWSQLTRLKPTYLPDSPHDLPAHLLLKLCGPDSGSFGDSEVAYYTRDYRDLADAPLPRCYAAAYEAMPRRYHLLIEDLSDTHTNCWNREPTEAHARLLADTVAALHSHHWVAQPQVGLFPASVDRYVAHVGAGLEPLLAHAGDLVSAEQSTWLRTSFPQITRRYAERVRQGQGFTMLHGDLNPGNILVPQQAEAPNQRMYLIDRQPFDWSLTQWLGVSDLVYAMVVWWSTAARRNLEEPTLRRYHAALRARGIQGYSWEQLYADYRLCLIEAIAVATEWCVLEADRERMRWLWEQQLQRALIACADLDLAERW